MDDVSGLAEESIKFASFLTFARKSNYTCVYIFHTIYLEKSIWRTILSQTNIFNIFPASVRKILGVCIRKTRKYIPQSALWISRLFIELANRNDRVCLTLDCSGINKDGPGRFRTDADKPNFQICYFNLANDEQAYNEFVSERINENESNDRIQFKIIHLKSKTNKEENFDMTEEIQDSTKNSRHKNKWKREKKSLPQAQNLLKSVMQDMERDLELNQNFFLGDNFGHEQNVICNQKIIPKKTIKKRNKKNYSPAKVRSRNFLTNISYNRLKRINFNNASFIIDCYTYILFNLNPFFLERKFDNKSDRKYVETLWNYLTPNKFYIYV